MAKISIQKLTELLTEKATKYVTSEEASCFAQNVIVSHTMKWPRNNQVSSAIKDIKAWENGTTPKIVVDKNASLLINFDKTGPALKLKYIHDELESRAKTYGISICGLYNNSGLHDMAFWTRGLAERNLIAIAGVQGGYGSVVPTGGTKGILGTNPLSYAIPTNSHPILADFATSEMAYFEFANHKKANKKLPEDVALDSEGRPTTDPQKAEPDWVNLLPMGGGHKGFSIVLLMEILTSSLMRGLLSTEQDEKQFYPVDQLGAFVIAIDISTFNDIDKFKNSVTEMCDQLRNQPKAPGFTNIYMPGDQSYARWERVQKAGEVEVTQESLDLLK